MASSQERRKPAANALHKAHILNEAEKQNRDLRQAKIRNMKRNNPGMKYSLLLLLPTIISIITGTTLTLYSSVHSIGRDTMFWEETEQADYRFAGLVFLLAGFLFLLCTYFVYKRARKKQRRRLDFERRKAAMEASRQAAANDPAQQLRMINSAASFSLSKDTWSMDGTDSASSCRVDTNSTGDGKSIRTPPATARSKLLSKSPPSERSMKIEPPVGVNYSGIKKSTRPNRFVDKSSPLRSFNMTNDRHHKNTHQSMDALPIHMKREICMRRHNSETQAEASQMDVIENGFHDNYIAVDEDRKSKSDSIVYFNAGKSYDVQIFSPRTRHISGQSSQYIPLHTLTPLNGATPTDLGMCDYNVGHDPDVICVGSANDVVSSYVYDVPQIATRYQPAVEVHNTKRHNRFIVGGD